MLSGTVQVANMLSTEKPAEHHMRAPQSLSAWTHIREQVSRFCGSLIPCSITVSESLHSTSDVNKALPESFSSLTCTPPTVHLSAQTHRLHMTTQILYFGVLMYQDKSEKQIVCVCVFSFFQLRLDAVTCSLWVTACCAGTQVRCRGLASLTRTRQPQRNRGELQSSGQEYNTKKMQVTQSSHLRYMEDVPALLSHCFGKKKVSSELKCL